MARISPRPAAISNTSITSKFQPTDEQLRISYALLAHAALVREKRAEMDEAEQNLVRAKNDYKQTVAQLVNISITQLKFSQDRCRNEVADFHVYRLDDDAHPCVFCSMFEPDPE